MKFRTFTLTLTSVAVLSFGFLVQAKSQANVGTSANRVSIMTFNAENLFDTVDDVDRDDETFLPLAYKKSNPSAMRKCDSQSSDFYKEECRKTDWNEAVFETKISRVGDVIRSVNGGRGPDIQILSEIENINALRQLRDRKLADLDYSTMELIEGPDTRGIDLAVLSRLPMWDRSQLHIIPFKEPNGNPSKEGARSRGILEVRLLLPDGQKVAVFAGHFPSMSHPTFLRVQAIQELNRLESMLPKDVLAIAGGDFNSSNEEDQTAGTISQLLAGEWTVAHLVGCRGCKGTEVYKSQWSFLDNLSFSPSMNANGSATWLLDIPSIEVPHSVPEHTNKFGEPARFRPPSEGISDHWPIYAEIYKR